MSQNKNYTEEEDEQSSEIEIQPPIRVSRAELEYHHRRHKFFSLIYKREGIMGSSTEASAAEESATEKSAAEESAAEESSHKPDKVPEQNEQVRRSLRKKNTLAIGEYNEKSECEDFSISTDSYIPSSESESDKENYSSKNAKIKEMTVANDKRHSKKNIHRRSLSLNSTLLDINIDESIISYDSEIFDNVTISENNTEVLPTIKTTDISKEDENKITEVTIYENNTEILPTIKTTDISKVDKNKITEVNIYENNTEILPTIKTTYISKVDENKITEVTNNQNVEIHCPENVVVVAQTSNDGPIRKWDKKQACLFCSKLVAKLPRHLESKHNKETEVVKMLSFPIGSEERKIIIDDLRKKGNYFHNTSVIKTSSGTIIPKKRSKSASCVEALLPCPSCLAFYSKAKLSRHYSNCLKRDELKAKKVQKEGSMLLPMSASASEKLRNNVLSRMTNDEITLVVKQDDLILQLGSKLATKHDQDPHLYGYISQKMREMARFLMAMRKIYPAIQNLTECINPIFFPKVIEAVRTVASYDPITSKYGTPSLALKVGHSLKKCANIVITNSIINNISRKKEMAENFIKLCETEWSTNISTGALTTLYRNKWNMPDRLPLAEDVKVLNHFLCEERDKYMALLKNAEVTIHNWTSLAKIVLAQTLLFNRRRSGEVEKIPVETYLKKLTSKDVDKSICKTLSEFEKAISQSFVRFEVRGKKGRRVPIILYPKLIEAYDTLMLYRFHVGIPEENIFFFASPPLSHFRGSDVMRTFAAASGAKQPLSLTSTKLRKNIATMSQILNLSNHELDQLAKFMGHDIRVHREYYRLPESTIQLAKISKILIASEKGKLHQFKGKNLDEINININKISDDNESVDNEDENETNLSVSSSQNIQQDIQHTAQEEIMPESPEKKLNSLRKKPKKKKATTDQRIKKKKMWSAEEKRVVEDYFSKAIIRQKVPCKDDCMDCFEKHAEILKDRDWKAIKYYVYNIILRNKKK